jgi:pimeloyl-ACP methyl ester carboxylesterase
MRKQRNPYVRCSHWRRPPFQYTYGAKNPKQISPDNWTFDQIFRDRPGNDAIQLDLLHDYNSKLALYDGWHEYFRTSQPRTLILWRKNDPFFTVEGAKAYQRDLPKAELHLLDTGPFCAGRRGRLYRRANPGVSWLIFSSSRS